MTAYRPGRTRIARLIERDEKQRRQIRELRDQGKGELADQLERLGQAVDQAPRTDDAAAKPAAPPVDPWWDR